jgi:hypothetical protein
MPSDSFRYGYRILSPVRLLTSASRRSNRSRQLHDQFTYFSVVDAFTRYEAEAPASRSRPRIEDSRDPENLRFSDDAGLPAPAEAQASRVGRKPTRY